MSDRVLIQEFDGGTTYIAEGPDLETAQRYMGYAMQGQPGCICMTNADKSRMMVAYGGPDFENQEMTEDLALAMVGALGLSMDDFRSWMSGEKNEGGTSC
jgi:hypothetical protein